MEQLKDNIYNAYYAGNGETIGKETRERVHWITQNVGGTNILDIGCSQGITSILLGREGKKVLGLDSSTSAIEDAKRNLVLEEEETQKRIEFEKGNFFIREFAIKYDTVILGEMLEHITDLKTFFNKAISVTKEGGRIIVTAPFGMNEFIDHKRTFYLLDFLKLQGTNLVAEEIKYFGKWIGIIYKKRENNSRYALPNEAVFEQFEAAVYTIEENYLTKQEALMKKLEDNEKGKREVGSEEITVSNQDYLNEKTEKVKLQKELYDVYSKNESLINRHNKLLHDHEVLLDRYHSLKNSKLGKLTTKYWKLRRKKRGR